MHKDPAVRRAYMREWKRKNAKQHRHLNKLADAAIHANARAEKYGVPGHLTADDVRQCLAVGRCAYCHGTERLGIDHVVPMSEGGPNTPDNITAACHSCNASKWCQDRPGLWSRKHDHCQGCGTTSRRHVAKGLCNPCYIRSRRPVAA